MTTRPPKPSPFVHCSPAYSRSQTENPFQEHLLGRRSRRLSTHRWTPWGQTDTPIPLILRRSRHHSHHRGKGYVHRIGGAFWTLPVLRTGGVMLPVLYTGSVILLDDYSAAIAAAFRHRSPNLLGVSSGEPLSGTIYSATMFSAAEAVTYTKHRRLSIHRRT